MKVSLDRLMPALDDVKAGRGRRCWKGADAGKDESNSGLIVGASHVLGSVSHEVGIVVGSHLGST